MAFVQSALIELKRLPKKGRGVFARGFIRAETVIERVPVVVVPRAEFEDLDQPGVLAEYCFVWSETSVALALGYGSLYNHSFTPNARYDDRPDRTKVFIALRDIQPGEEITINYNGTPEDGSPMHFEVM